MLQTHSDQYVDPLAMREHEISIYDIAYHLSNICRFTGAADRSPRGDVYTVAQHSVFVSEIAHGHKLAALLHDAPEYVLNDMHGPTKRDSFLGEVYKLSENKLARVVERCGGIDPHELEHPVVKAADTVALLIEAWHLMRRPSWAATCPQWGKEFKVVPWSHVEAEQRFLARFEELA
jgi:uncharacterized protein